MKTLLLAAFILALTACAGSSPRIAPAQLSELEKGRTTVTEVVRKFGRPSLVSKNPDGTQTAIYMHDEAASDTTTMIPLVSTTTADSETFYFDSKGVLTDYKITHAAAKPAPASAQSGADKSAPGAANNSTAAATGGTEKSAATSAAKSDDKAPKGQPSGWSFLIPSATKDNR